MSDGSGSSVNPWASTEVSSEGRSPNEKRTASRAPDASITAATMVRAVCRKSRSAVSSGPKSASASTVRKSFLRLFPCNPLRRCEKPEHPQRSIQPGDDCWLVWCEIRALHSSIRKGDPIVSNVDNNVEDNAEINAAKNRQELAVIGKMILFTIWARYSP